MTVNAAVGTKDGEFDYCKIALQLVWFKITRMISNQIAILSIQLPLVILLILWFRLVLLWLTQTRVRAAFLRWKQNGPQDVMNELLVIGSLRLRNGFRRGFITNG